MSTRHGERLGHRGARVFSANSRNRPTARGDAVTAEQSGMFISFSFDGTRRDGETLTIHSAFERSH